MLVVALVAATWWYEGPGARTPAGTASEVTAVLVAPDTLLLRYSGGPPIGASEWCGSDGHAAVEETDGRVVVGVDLVRSRRGPRAWLAAWREEIACLDVGYQRSVEVRLDGPLADRPVVDRTGRTLEVRDYDGPRWRATWLPEGYVALFEGPGAGQPAEWSVTYQRGQGAHGNLQVSVDAGGRADVVPDAPPTTATVHGVPATIQRFRPDVHEVAWTEAGIDLRVTAAEPDDVVVRVANGLERVR